MYTHIYITLSILIALLFLLVLRKYIYKDESFATEPTYDEIQGNISKYATDYCYCACAGALGSSNCFCKKTSNACISFLSGDPDPKPLELPCSCLGSDSKCSAKCPAPPPGYTCESYFGCSPDKTQDNTTGANPNPPTVDEISELSITKNRQQRACPDGYNFAKCNNGIGLCCSKKTDFVWWGKSDPKNAGSSKTDSGIAATNMQWGFILDKNNLQFLSPNKKFQLKIIDGKLKMFQKNESNIYTEILDVLEEDSNIESIVIDDLGRIIIQDYESKRKYGLTYNKPLRAISLQDDGIVKFLSFDGENLFSGPLL